ncbi:MAG: D-hexose-6-phosphate mutarotase [Akkermansiaceae bacterium]|nr:D-hexose-6-phosphate mutarotase [Akkermansiaceae bacterium]
MQLLILLHSPEQTMVTTVYPYGEDFPILKIETALCTAEISLYGGQVLSWTPTGHKPVIYMSPKAVFKKGKALRGGIPLCWPWFGKNTEDASLPPHGVARISTWQVGRCEEGEDGRVNLLLALPPENEMLPSAALGMEIGNELTLSLITLDVPRAMPYSAAMHTYFAVSDYEQVAVTGLEDLEFTEFADDAVPHPEDPLIPLGHIDRIYHPVPENAEITIHDPAWERSIRICRAGSASAVVWNPGATLAAGMGDLGEGNERGFLAVETTAVPAENLMLRCGETHELTTRIQVFGVN